MLHLDHFGSEKRFLKSFFFACSDADFEYKKERAVSNLHLRQNVFRGSADLGKKRRSWGREAYLHTSRPQNGGKKSPIKIEIRKDFYTITVSFIVFYYLRWLFLLFDGLFWSCQM
jgi:hypothetical protein